MPDTLSSTSFWLGVAGSCDLGPASWLVGFARPLSWVSALPSPISEMLRLPRRDCGTEGKFELVSEKSSKPLSGVGCFQLLIICFLNDIFDFILKGISAWQWSEKVKVRSAVTSEVNSGGDSHLSEMVFVVTEMSRNEGFGASCSTAPCWPRAWLMVGAMSGRRERGTSGWVGWLDHQHGPLEGLVEVCVHVLAREEG